MQSVERGQSCAKHKYMSMFVIALSRLDSGSFSDFTTLLHVQNSSLSTVATYKAKQRFFCIDRAVVNIQFSKQIREVPSINSPPPNRGICATVSQL